MTACLVGLLLMACTENKTEPAKNTHATQVPSAPHYDSKNPNWETITVATQANYPPFSFKDQDGKIIGFERELMQAIANAGKFNVEFINGERTRMAEHLNANGAGIWSSSITITPERQETMEFSEPYFSYQRQVMILHNEYNVHIETLADLKNKTLSYSNMSNTERDKALSVSQDESLLIPESTTFLAMKNVYSGKTVGVLVADRVVDYYTKQYPKIDIRLIPTDEPTQYMAFAVKKGNHALKDKINAGLAKVKADGTYDKLVNKWFNQKS